ncbi:MAG: hypothetical protein OXG11_11915 [Chloroflexi bacterium]|nr:hypothetical protein [Chloroflexota bacterium]
MEDPVARALIESLQEDVRFIQQQLWAVTGGLVVLLAAPWVRQVWRTILGNGKSHKHTGERNE